MVWTQCFPQVSCLPDHDASLLRWLTTAVRVCLRCCCCPATMRLYRCCRLSNPRPVARSGVAASVFVLLQVSLVTFVRQCIGRLALTNTFVLQETARSARFNSVPVCCVPSAFLSLGSVPNLPAFDQISFQECLTCRRKHDQSVIVVMH